MQVYIFVDPDLQAQEIEPTEILATRQGKLSVCITRLIKELAKHSKMASTSDIPPFKNRSSIVYIH
jgi:hypothetical protein